MGNINLAKTGSKLLIATLASVLFFGSVSASAQTPSPQQIEQFKRMPPAQQQALARSMGIDLDDINALIKGGGTAAVTTPRETISGVRAATSPEANDLLSGDLDDVIESVSESDFKAYGYDLFKFGADTFAPATDIPVPANYVLGPGDTLIIQLYGKESDQYNLTLSRDGSILFPKIGPVSLAGLSYAQAVKKISDVVSEQMIGIKSSVTLGPLRTIRVFVLGEVNVPGSYVVGSLSTMTNALFSSGGVTTIGSLRNIQLKRAGKIVTTLDLYDLLLRGDTSTDTRLLPGDVLFVPPVGRTAAVDGAVKRPALYELKYEKTVADLITLAGGLRPTAYLPSVKLERINGNGEKTFVKVDSENLATTTQTINDADILRIGSTLDQINDAVNITGHVKREDSYAWKAGLRFSEIVTSPHAFLALPDLDLALIEREADSTREISALSFSPRKAFDKPFSDSDPVLNARDTIRIFGFEEARSELLEPLVDRLKLQASYAQRQRTVRIDGSVRFPGEYPLTVDMSAKTLVQLAGGYTESALGRKAEITRYDLSEARERVVLHIGVNLTSEDPVLQEGDTLRVQQIPLWKDKESITLTGEFIHPGIYAILPGESLLDVIERAGGLTAQAYPLGTIFSRADLRELEAERLEALKAEVESDIAASRLESSDTTQDVNTEEAEQILANIDRTKPLGRMVIDLPNIFEHPTELDFQLIEGDSVVVPRYKPSVTVVGEVQYPTSHFFDAKLSVKAYLERSGGLKRNADKRRVYVVKANGMVFRPKGTGWFGSRNAKLSPGDTIVVPIDTKRVDKLTLWSSVTRMMYEAALGVAAISSL